VYRGEIINFDLNPEIIYEVTFVSFNTDMVEDEENGYENGYENGHENGEEYYTTENGYENGENGNETTERNNRALLAFLIPLGFLAVSVGVGYGLHKFDVVDLSFIADKFRRNKEDAYDQDQDEDDDE